MHKVRATIVLGSPASNCAKYGICSVDEEKNPDAWDRFTPLHHRHVKALISAVEGNKISVEFMANSMHPITPGMFFTNAGFLIECPKAIPLSITQQLGLPASSEFAPGVWPIHQTADAFIVEIPSLVMMKQ